MIAWKRCISILIILLFSHNLFAKQCPYNYEEQLLKYLIKKVTWADINSLNNPCEFTIRYFPCDSKEKSMLMLIHEFNAEKMPHCKVIHSNTPVADEGYCSLQNVVIDCT